MVSAQEKILVIEGDPASRQGLVEVLSGAGYEVTATASAEEGFEAVRKVGIDLLLLDANLAGLDCCAMLPEVKGSASTASIRAILLSSGGVAERVRALDLGADDVLARPWDAAELLARVRAQLRAKRALDELRDKTRIAEEGQQIAHTAFQALAVTEKMTRDAFTLGRGLKLGISILFLLAVVIAGVFFLYRSRAEHETRRAYSVIAQLERGVARQEELVAQARRMREQLERSAGATATVEQERLQEADAALRAQMAGKDSAEMADLRRQLEENAGRLRRIEEENQVAQNLIRSYARSVCLIHVVVGFRDKASGGRLRYAGINPQGEPLQDSEGNPIFSLVGRGPEVRADFFGTGFIAGPGGRILTNRHVAEPWWKNDELQSVAQQGLQPVIAEISAYFPDWPRAARVEIQKLSPEADLAVLQGELSELKRPVLVLDEGAQAAASGQPVVLIGYATGLAAILARAGDETVQSIVAAAQGQPKQVMAELARRNLIRPLATQGHIGDVLPDKIVYDAQTTVGSSGGPLFNFHGKVIGVTYAGVRGFGGSNFGIPVRYATPLLRP